MGWISDQTETGRRGGSIRRMARTRAMERRKEWGNSRAGRERRREGPGLGIGKRIKLGGSWRKLPSVARGRGPGSQGRGLGRSSAGLSYRGERHAESDDGGDERDVVNLDGDVGLGKRDGSEMGVRTEGRLGGTEGQ